MTNMSSGMAGDIAPSGMMVDFLQGQKVGEIRSTAPEFGWIVHSSCKDDVQVAYQLLVASHPDLLLPGKADAWDSGRVDSDASINVPYRGKTLQGDTTYYWTVKTWCKHGGESAWSSIVSFTTGKLGKERVTARHPLVRTRVSPASIVKRSRRHYLVDFGKVAFGYLHIELSVPGKGNKIRILLGERGDAKGVNKRPGRNIRFHKIVQALAPGNNSIDVHAPVNVRNTGVHAIKLPPEVGVVTPFRYVEISGCPVDVEASMIWQVAVHYPFDDRASSFESSNPLLDDIWALCKYSMKATSFCGVYVDGDRERIPYEADAYINQLSHYAVDREYSIARYSHEYLLVHPTWPTEWKHHSVLMAWADYLYSGNDDSLSEHYAILATKTLEDHARPDGLLDTRDLRDVVDWPAGERDDFEFTAINTVVNAFYYNALVTMARIAAVLGKDADVAGYRQKAELVKTSFNKVFFDASRGIYIDGENATHASLHANMMPLAFDLVPEERKKSVLDFVASRGMACSVYGAQYLLEALYKGGRPDVALDRIVSKDLRSWYNMLRLGSTITLEAWDNRFKKNQDWNHAWGSAPGNIIARYLLGIQPLEPGFAKVLIQPQPARLEHASATVPTIRGPVSMAFKNLPSRSFEMVLEIPANMVAMVGLPDYTGQSNTIIVDGENVTARVENGYRFVDGIGSGSHVLRAE